MFILTFRSLTLMFCSSQLVHRLYIISILKVTTCVIYSITKHLLMSECHNSQVLLSMEHGVDLEARNFEGKTFQWIMYNIVYCS